MDKDALINSTGAVNHCKLIFPVGHCTAQQSNETEIKRRVLRLTNSFEAQRYKREFLGFDREVPIGFAWAVETQRQRT